ncbi:hypothetical protein L6164_036833 [Bauhinia variegata]|nr:hypothetical protein L6164_036833 [Bauhinia variegata]
MSSSSSSSSSPKSIWVLSYIKLQFFTRIRRFLHSKATRKRCEQSDQFHIPKNLAEASDEVEINMVQVMQKQSGQEEESVAKLVQRSVKNLHFGSWEEKEMAAEEIEKLAKDDVKVRKLMMELGVVPVLVSLAASTVASQRRAGIKALIQLANGTYT